MSETVYIKNILDVDLTPQFDGKHYTFPAGKVVSVDDADVAKWFVRKFTAPPRGRLRVKAELEISGTEKDEGHGLEIVTLKAGEKPDAEIKMHEPDPNAKPQKDARVHPPRGKGAPPSEPDAKTKGVMLRAAIAGMDPDAQVREGTKRGLWKKGMEKRELVDKLAEAGFVPPGFRG